MKDEYKLLLMYNMCSKELVKEQQPPVSHQL